MIEGAGELPVVERGFVWDRIELIQLLPGAVRENIPQVVKPQAPVGREDVVQVLVVRDHEVPFALQDPGDLL